MDNHTEKIRTNLRFRDFLNDMISEAFPDTFDPKKARVIPVRCPKDFESLCHKIAREAYVQNGLRRNSMLYAIDLAMHQEYDCLLQQVNLVLLQKEHDTESTVEKVPKTICWDSYIEQLPHCFPAKFPINLPATYDEFYSESSAFGSGKEKKWDNWLRGDAIPHPHVRFRLLRLLIYGILCPRNNRNQLETPSCTNARIAKFLKKLMYKYLHCTLPGIDSLDDSLVFSCYFDQNSMPVLSDGISAFISMVLFLTCLSVCEVFSGSEKSFTIKEFLMTLRKRIDLSNANYQAFVQTQTEIIFYAHPFYRDSKEFCEPPTLSHYKPPAIIPWELKDFSANHALRFHITAPPARGKTQLYRAIGRVLASELASPDSQSEIKHLADYLHLPTDTAFVIVALNAQQFKWYCRKYTERPCDDFVDMFFRGTLEHNGQSKDTVDTIMNTIVPQKIKNALKNRRFIFLFDGFDELLYTPVQDIFLDALQKFVRCYPDAHLLLLSRTISPTFQAMFSRLHIEEVPLCIASMDSPCYADRYQDALMVPMIERMHASNQFHSLAEMVTQYAFRVIDKVYDYPARSVNPQLWDGRRSICSIMKELAWNYSLQPNSSVIHHLSKLLFGSKPAKEDAIHVFARQSGVLDWDSNLQDYYFSSIQIQAVLAAAYIRDSVKWNANASLFRNSLNGISDPLNLEIAFTLIHTIHKQAPLFAETLLLDFAFRQRSDPYRDHANYDISHMLRGDYGETPLQRSENATLQHIFSLLSLN